MTNHKLLAVTMTTLMVFSMFSGVVFLSSDTVSAANSTPARFEITDAGNAGGDLYVTIKGKSDDGAKDFRFWYNDQNGGGTLGPVELGGGSFSEAYAGTPKNKGGSYPAGTEITTDQVVTFEFDSSTTDYDFEANGVRLNATAFDKSYATADTGNRSVYTDNYYHFAAKDASGNPLSNYPVLLYDSSTNETRTTDFLTSGTFAMDCAGVDVSGTCTDPDTGTTVPLSTPHKTYQQPIALEAFSMPDGNSSGKVDPSVSTTTTLTTDVPKAPTFLGLSSLTKGGPQPTADTVKITNASSGNVVWQSSNIKYESKAPVFLRPNTEYTVTLQNSSTFGTETRSLTLPTKGISAVSLRLPTTQVATSPVTGQIVDESGNPVEDAVVIAQPEYASGNRVDVYNSTTTDSNGLFTMALPESGAVQQDYGFRIVGTDTSGGTPIYYPTSDANDGDGYVVQSSRTVLPPMTLQKGGRVDISVTSGKPTLPTPYAFTSLSQVSTAYPDTERTANSNSFSQFSFGQRPKSAAVSLMAPTTGSQTQVTYNVWGRTQSPSKYVCAGQPSVSQGAATSSTCTLAQSGTLNVSVSTYDSIIKHSSATPESVDGIGFFFRNTLVVRDATTGETVTYLGPDGIQQSFLGTQGTSQYVQIPVPAGKYEVALRPAYEFAPTTSVNDTSTVQVSGGGSKQVQLDRGQSFRVRPSYKRSQRSFKRSGENTIAVRVSDPVVGSLTDSDVSVQAFLENPDRTTVSDPVTLSYNSTDKTFETKTFKPSSRSIDAGRYRLSVRATYTDGDRTYNSTFTRPVQVSGFQTAVQIGSRTVAPGDSILGQIRAYDGNTAIDASSSSQTTVTVYDQNGKQVKQINPSTGFSGGQGSFSLTMPGDPGRYRVSVRVKSDSGSQGIGERWVQVDTVDLDVETDQETYSPQDTVTVDVEASDATDGSAIQDASLTLRINGQRVSASTDSNGEATIDLKPGTYGSGAGGTWARGTGISVTLAHDTGSSVVRKTDGTFFEVQQFDVGTRPTAEAFKPSESSVLEVQVQKGTSVNSVAVTDLDGESVQIGGDPASSPAVTSPASGVYRIDLGQRAVGEHLATVTVDGGAAGKQSARTQFRVQQYSVSTSLNKRSFDAGETISLDVSVRNPDGSVATNKNVLAALNTTGPIRTVDSASASTGSNGDATLSLSSSQSGFHFIEVSVGDQTRYVGLSVSSVSARLEDSSGNPVSEYTAKPGTTQTIYVNATKSDGSDVAEDSTVRAGISAYGEQIELGSAKTTNGDASISFDIPSSVPAREYPLIVQVVTAESGGGTTTGTLNVTGANAKEITTTTNESAYSPGGTARFEATLTTGDGSAIANKKVDFVVETDGAPDKRVGTVQTNTDGVATFDYAIPSGANDGEYVLRAALNQTSSIRAYSGYRVRSLDVSTTVEDGPFNPGDTVNLTVYANDSTTGSAVDATDGSVELLLSGSNVATTVDTSGSSPYETSITLPDDSSITGTRSLSVTVQKDRASDSDSTLIEVRDDTESANLSIQQPVTAGQATTVTVNGTVDTTAVLTAYSPGAGSVAYNSSVQVSASSDTTTDMTIDSPGTYVVRLSVPGVGAITEVTDVEAGNGNPTVWTGTSTSANATEFNRSEDIYLKTNRKGMTATVISDNDTYTVTLDQKSGDTYYGVLSANRASNVYLVRLDSESATSVDDTIVEVSG